MRIIYYHEFSRSNTGYCFGLEEMLLDAAFTIYTILKSHLRKIAVILGIEVYTHKLFLIPLRKLRTKLLVC